MNRILTKTIVLSLMFLTLLAFKSNAQTSISGNISDESGPLVGANIIVKGTVLGTISDLEGNFSLNVSSTPPFTMSVSVVGYTTQEIEISDANVSDLSIKLEEAALLGQVVVISASRMEESIMDSPVSVEKMDILDISNTASDSYYKGIANLKGVDMTQSSINFQIINSRGFNGTSNTRFVQLVDGMDTQAPALNFPIGNLNGPSELDVESVEFIPGAASALYGPNAFNGILLINSKNAFDYQGLSATVKMSVNHLGDDSNLNANDPVANPDGLPIGPGGVQPMYEAGIRYAKAFNNKFAFKLNFSYSAAKDWYGTSLQDRNAALKPAGFTHNPGADRLHAFGDEVSTNIALLAASPDFAKAIAAAGIPSSALSLLPNMSVSRTPYLEEPLVDYNAKNIKFNGGLFYRLNDKLELSYNINYGAGTSVYTGAQRYSLLDFNVAQHKLELRSDNFFVRGYLTQEQSGNSYIADLTGVLINESWKSSSQWFGEYGGAYLGGVLNGLSEENAHLFARGVADIGRFEPGSQQFKSAKNTIIGNSIPNGSKFADDTRMYHFEGQYNFKNEVKFMDILVGASYRYYELRSNGTIFPDSDENPITVNEFGAYVQASDKFINDKLKLTASIRYDKNENFDGQFNPRVSAVIKAAKNNNIRISYQTGFRNPTTQGQHIDLNVLSARLIGGMPYYRDKYNIYEYAYTMSSVNEYVSAVSKEIGGPLGAAALGNPANINLLVPVSEATLPTVKPEQISTIEIGYRSVLGDRLMLDMAYYYNVYNDFITQVQVRKASGILDQSLDDSNPADPSWLFDPATEMNIRNAQTLLTPITTSGMENTFQTYTNFDKQVKAQGFTFGADYSLGKGYIIGGNYNWNKMTEGLGENFLNEFNTPENKINVSFKNRKLTDNLGFNITLRYQDEFTWESSFGRGQVPAFTTIDAQVSYKLKSIKSVVKLGGSNLTNLRYVMNYGGPTLGAVYYLSLTFDQLMN